jgi:hypothetical protein
MEDFTFLTKEQIKELDIMKYYGTKAVISDFAILLGGYATKEYYISDNSSKKDLIGCWWSKTYDANGVLIIDSFGYDTSKDPLNRRVCARPYLQYSKIADKCISNVSINDDISLVQYGEYPQKIVLKEYANKLEQAYRDGTIKKTGKKYTTDSIRYQDKDSNFRVAKYSEYEYEDKKYIRFIGDSNCNGAVLSDGRVVHAGFVYWVSVDAITWIVDKKKDIALSKNLLFSGIRFNNEKNYIGDFQNTEIKRYLDECFRKEIIPEEIYRLTKSNERKDKIINDILAKLFIYQSDLNLLIEEVENIKDEDYTLTRKK